LKILAAPFESLLLLIAALITAAVACSSGGPSGTCTNTFPSSCTVAPPSFDADVAPVIHAHCTPCHGPGQQIPTLDTYANVTKSMTESRIIFVYQMCSMPPKPLPALTTAQWETITNWLACGTAP